jgi:polyphosphate kinase
VPLSGEPDLLSTSLYLNRELSWLEFNSRVLAEAENEQVPLLERLKFHAIVASNLDEFFMVRVAGLKQQLTGDVGEIPPDGMTVNEALTAISARVHQLSAQQMISLETQLLPRLAEQGVVLVTPEQLDGPALALLDERFHNEVFPILTPIAIDPGHPFPHLRNKSLNLGVMFMREGGARGGLRRRAGADDVAAPARSHRRQDAERAPGEARLRAAREAHRPARGNDLPGGAAEGGLHVPRHAQLRPRDR